MFKQSLKNRILINLGAFLLVAILEILSIWSIKDKFDTNYSFFLNRFYLTAHIMVFIWINHFILIPVFLDKRKNFLYGTTLIGSILLGSYLIGFDKGWTYVFKSFFFFIYTTGAGMAVYLLVKNSIIQRENIEKEKLQKEIELNYLKQQVNPHFLFNSLNSIYALSREQSLQTPEVVMQLSELMRYQLESSKKDFVLLKEELEFVENYLLLEEQRLGKRCAIDLLIETDLLNLKLPPMLLIPFVENAIKHGAQSTNNTSKIDIVVSTKNAMLYFSVFNSKPLITPVINRKGLGLENVKRRLSLLYPDAHVLEIEDREKEYRVNLSMDLSILKE